MSLLFFWSTKDMSDSTTNLEAQHPGNGLGPTSVAEETSGEDRATQEGARGAPTKVCDRPTRKGGGPRTPHGKATSSRNALKFGIFSKELVIEDAEWIPTETRENFDRLLKFYLDHYQPVGPVETHQIELAVGALWRYRRMLRAEAGEIQNRKRELDRIYDHYALPSVYAIMERCGSVPGPQDSERLQRYEGHLLRVFYRALTELERLQRMRFGQSVPAPVVIDLQN